jgi:hypothetical protein
MHRRRPLTAIARVVASVLALAVLATACGGDGSDVAAASLGELPGVTSTTAPPPTPRPTSELAALVSPAGSADTLPEPLQRLVRWR